MEARLFLELAALLTKQVFQASIRTSVVGRAVHDRNEELRRSAEPEPEDCMSKAQNML